MSEPQVPARRPPAVALPDARERVVERLGRLFADDQITQADLEARLERVYRTTSPAELEAIVADLPAESTAGEPGTSVAATGGETRIRAFMAAVERQWSGPVPRRLDVRGSLGYVELDLSDATFDPGVTVIDVRAFMGYVQLRFPAGVRVESQGRAFAGFFSLKGAGEKGSERVVRIVGRAAFGFVEGFVAAGEGPPAPRLPGRTG